MTASRVSRGTTLLELIIVLALMSLLAGIVTVSLRAMAPPDRHTSSDIIAESLRAAASDGRSRFVTGRDSSGTAVVLPDGRVVADSSFHVEYLTGRPPHAP